VFAIASIGRCGGVAAIFVSIGLAGCAQLRLESFGRFGLAMTPQSGSQMVDPLKPVVIEPKGFGTRLTKVEVHDDTGKPLSGISEETRFTIHPPLDFGKRYAVRVTLENALLGKTETRELAFATVSIPRLDGPTRLALAPDSSVTLHFDQPVGRLRATGDLVAEVQPDEKRQTIRLVASNYAQGQTIPVEVTWETPNGILLPPFKLELTTPPPPPPMTAEINIRGLTNAGLALPLQITFSEPLADRDDAEKHLLVRTDKGETVTGRWRWISERRLRFNPQPHWPASTTIEVRSEPGGLRSLRGGTLAQPLVGSFTTGPDRQIFVYLDAQRVAALENGQVVRTFKVSTGKVATPTVTGSYYIYSRFPLKTMRSRAKPGEPGHYVVENVPYVQYFHEDYAFHGAWWHNGFGRPASHGCINMATRRHNRRWPSSSEDAGWLYHWASVGVPVTVLRSASGQFAMH